MPALPFVQCPVCLRLFASSHQLDLQQTNCEEASRPMEDVGREHPLETYVAGEDRYVRFAEDILGLDLADV
jgi:hypothetical protein